jgi:hypothetical protein
MSEQSKSPAEYKTEHTSPFEERWAELVRGDELIKSLKHKLLEEIEIEYREKGAVDLGIFSYVKPTEMEDSAEAKKLLKTIDKSKWCYESVPDIGKTLVENQLEYPKKMRVGYVMKRAKKGQKTEEST